MSLDYLTQKYLTKDEPTKKKGKKRKRKNQEAGVIIADDDVLGWERDKGKDEDEDDVTVGETTRAFRHTTKSNWTSVNVDVNASADAIVTAAAPSDPSNLPTVVVVPTTSDAKSVQKMSSGAHAGLQTAAQVTAQLEAQRQAEQARFAAQDPRESGKGQETIYRDASGRIINLAMQRAEARKKMEEEEAKERRAEQMQKGHVQLVQQAERKKELEDARYQPLARYADDRELNDELKERGRWNDPAAAFLSSKKLGVSRTGKPLYEGAAPPNRHGILPGHRWDGVDRSNGWEKKWFQAQNARRNRAQLEHDMEIDV